ncbi:hypothetical protein AQI94_16115 [Streptomyces pseudovenezuelae]|uniref:Uncharacterized protein n=1 Tax=Streptomyces pseudovenezuelae TaxID=67350 RepID=A0A101N6P7_9ACTN|nr:hypothetical protein AQI94_16115 [Streptomyces pseudovenezuelae]
MQQFVPTGAPQQFHALFRVSQFLQYPCDPRLPHVQTGRIAAVVDVMTQQPRQEWLGNWPACIMERVQYSGRPM